jgi:hypothetical protein
LISVFPYSLIDGRDDLRDEHMGWEIEVVT